MVICCVRRRGFSDNASVPSEAIRYFMVTYFHHGSEINSFRVYHFFVCRVFATTDVIAISATETTVAQHGVDYHHAVVVRLLGKNRISDKQN